MLLLLNKPFQVLSQFSSDGDKQTLADYIHIPHVYPAGRLDYDSEGLLLLTDQGALQHLIASPAFKMPKTYWVQVEGNITDEAIAALSQGVELKDGKTQTAQCERIAEPTVWARVPPIRERANIPTSWIALTITEGKNRQVRRMTAHVGFPTLRLIRAQIGPYTLENVQSGQYLEVQPTPALLQQLEEFEHERTRKTTSPHRRRPHRKSGALSDDKRTSRRTDRSESTSRSRRKR